MGAEFSKEGRFGRNSKAQTTSDTPPNDHQSQQNTTLEHSTTQHTLDKTIKTSKISPNYDGDNIDTSIADDQYDNSDDDDVRARMDIGNDSIQGEGENHTFADGDGGDFSNFDDIVDYDIDYDDNDDDTDYEEILTRINDTNAYGGNGGEKWPYNNIYDDDDDNDINDMLESDETTKNNHQDNNKLNNYESRNSNFKNQIESETDDFIDSENNKDDNFDVFEPSDDKIQNDAPDENIPKRHKFNFQRENDHFDQENEEENEPQDLQHKFNFSRFDTAPQTAKQLAEETREYLSGTIPDGGTLTRRGNIMISNRRRVPASKDSKKFPFSSQNPPKNATIISSRSLSNQPYTTLEELEAAYKDPFGHALPYTGLDYEDSNPYHPPNSVGALRPKFCLLPDRTKIRLRYDWSIRPGDFLNPTPQLILHDGRKLPLHKTTPLPTYTEDALNVFNHDFLSILPKFGLSVDILKQYYPRCDFSNVRTKDEFFEQIAMNYGRFSPIIGYDARPVIEEAFQKSHPDLFNVMINTPNDDDNDDDNLSYDRYQVPDVIKDPNQQWPTKCENITKRFNELVNNKDVITGKVIDPSTVPIDQKAYIVIPTRDDGTVPDVQNIMINLDKYVVQPFPSYFPVKLVNYDNYGNRIRHNNTPNNTNNNNTNNTNNNNIQYSRYPFNFPRMIDFAHYLRRNDNYRGKILPYSVLQTHLDNFLQKHEENDVSAFLTKKPELLLHSNSYNNNNDNDKSKYPHKSNQHKRYNTNNGYDPVYTISREMDGLKGNEEFLNEYLNLSPKIPSKYSLATMKELVETPTSLHSYTNSLSNPHTLLTAHGLPSTTSTQRLDIMSNTNNNNNLQNQLAKNQSASLSLHISPSLTNDNNNNNSNTITPEKACASDMEAYARCIDLNGASQESKCLSQLQLFLQCKRDFALNRR